MAQITGYVCDVCETFSLKRDGWLKVTPYVQGDNPGSGGIDVCSNRCLIRLGKERDGQEPKPPRQPRPGRYSEELRLEILAYADDTSIPTAAAKYNLPPSTIYRWKDAL